MFKLFCLFYSAGVGRTGTFIAIDMLTRYIQDVLSQDDSPTILNGHADKDDDDDPIYANLTDTGNGLMMENRKLLKENKAEIDIFRTVLWLRSQRRLLVQQEVSPVKQL